MLSFIAGDSELARRIRTFPWQDTDLGAPQAWPEALKTLVGVMLDANQPMFVAWGPQHRMIYNDQYIAVLGGHHPEALGRPLLEVWSEVADQLKPLVDDAYAGRPSHADDITFMLERRGYPEEAHFAYSYTPVRRLGGVVDGFFCACIETTDQVETARLIREREVRHRQILDSAIDYAIVATDLAGRVTSWNAGARRVLGWTEEEMLGKSLDRFFTPEDLAADRPADERRMALAGGRSSDERWHLHKGGERFWASGEMTVLRDPAGEATGFVKVLRDRTPEREAEEHLHQLNATLGKRVAAEVDVRMQTEEALRQSQKVEAIGQLTGGVAHDFNNLLTVIRGSVDLLRRPGVPDERRARYIDAIADTADRAAKLTGQLLAFARRQALKPEVFDVGANVGAVRDMIATLVGSRIRIVLEAPDEPCFIDADPSQFDTAVVNMAVNARDAMSGAGELTFRVGTAQGMPAIRAHPATAGDFVTVAIVDDGSGIAPGDLDHIFEPFFTTKGVGEGTGLGLSQVFGFAKQSGGDVIVESEPGCGTKFTLFLPRVAAPAAGVGTPVADGQADGQHGTCVLVVEDNPDVGRFATSTLMELGYSTVYADSGAAALAELGADAARFDVVFSDVVMPGMTGLELARVVRDRHPGLPIVLTSGYSHVLAEEGSGGFDLLQKPYSMDQLSRALMKAVR